MALDAPSDRRLFAYCLLAAVIAFAAILPPSIDDWLVFPIAVLVFAAVLLGDGYWRARS